MAIPDQPGLALFNSLPHEIIAIITEFLPRWDVNSLSQTCRHNHQRCLPFLYHDVRISRAEHCIRLRDALAAERVQTQDIKSLKFDYTYDWLEEPRKEGECLELGIALRLPELKILSIASPHDDTEQYQMSLGHLVEGLASTCWNISDCTLSYWQEDAWQPLGSRVLVLGLPTLRRLRLHYVEVTRDSAPLNPHYLIRDPQLSKLEYLEFRNCLLDPPSFGDILAVRATRALALYGAHDNWAFPAQQQSYAIWRHAEEIVRYGQDIEKLIIHVKSDNEFPTMLASLTKLRSLSITTEHLFGETIPYYDFQFDPEFQGWARKIPLERILPPNIDTLKLSFDDISAEAGFTNEILKMILDRRATIYTRLATLVLSSSLSSAYAYSGSSATLGVDLAACHGMEWVETQPRRAFRAPKYHHDHMWKFAYNVHIFHCISPQPDETERDECIRHSIALSEEGGIFDHVPMPDSPS